MSKEKMTKEEFIDYCYNKALGKIYFQMRELRIPTTMRIMEKEMDNFIIK